MANATLRLRAAFRSLLRRKRLSITAILILSLGIGLTALVFSILDAVLLHPADFSQPESIIQIQALNKNKAWDNVSPAVYDAVRARRGLFVETAGTRVGLFTVTGVPAPDQVFGVAVSPNYFPMLGAQPYMGRLFRAADDRPGAAPLAILSYRGWRQLFLADPHVVGKTAVIDGALYTIAGVMPPSFVPPGDNAAGLLWTTLRLDNAGWASNGRNLEVYARLRPCLSHAGAQQALQLLESQVTTSTHGAHELLQLRANAWRPSISRDRRTIVWLAMGMTCGLFLIGCANPCSILLADGIARRRDYAVSLAMGATRRQLIGHSVLEIGLLCSVSLTLVLAIGFVALPLLQAHLATLPTGIPNVARVRLSPPAVVFCFAVAVFSALLCGCLPALFATVVDISTGLRESTLKIAGSRSVRRILHVTISLEAAVSMLLLLTSLLLVRSLNRLLAEDHGFRTEHVLTMRLPSGSWNSGSPSAKDDEHRLIRHHLTLLSRAEATPGVEAAALASSLPLSHTVTRSHVVLPALAAQKHPGYIEPVSQCVTSGYFRALGIPILAGRSFRSADTASQTHVALVNQTFAREFLGDQDPVGQLLRDPKDKTAIQIVGLVKDSPHLDLAERIPPQIYFNFEGRTFTPFLSGLIVRTFQNPASVSSSLRKSLAEVDAGQAIVHITTMDSLIRENTWQPRFAAWLFSFFASLALGISAIGIYGVVSYVTAARRRDYGIRLSLGAAPVSLFRLVTAESLVPVTLGIALGAAGSYGVSRWIASLLYKASAFDPINLSAATGIFLFVALLAALLPALHTARMHPAVVLREE